MDAKTKPTRQSKPTPARMVESGQVAAFGHFDEPFQVNNIQEADVFGLGHVGARVFNRFRLKEWQHYAVFGPDFLFTFVAVNAHYLSNSFCYFVDRKNGAKAEHARVASPFSARIPDELWDSRCTFRASGFSVDIHNHLQRDRHTAKVSAVSKGMAPIEAELEFLADRAQHKPLEVILRLAPNRPAYSHKMACPAAGRIHIGNRVIELDPAKHLVLIDVHRAYYPYHMTWRWASCAGFDDQGRVVGLNLTHNVVADDTENNENAVWVGNRLSMLGAARFEFDQGDLLAPWTIRTLDDRCKVRFQPLGERAGSIQAGIVASDYHQPYGTFSGEAIDDEGRVHPIKDFFGVTEFHRARF
jgi:hypothetical protein